MPHKYPTEPKTSALRLLTDPQENHPNESLYTTCKETAQRLGANPETLRKWHQQANIHAGNAPSTTTDMAAENRRLRKEIAELRRANEILRTASA